MLDECNTEAEVELILRQSSAQRPAHCRRLLEDCRDILEYSTLEPPLKNMVVNRHFAAYVEDLWRKHQVVGRAGLKESISTSRLRSNAEAFVAPMIDPNSLGDWLEFPIKWALCIVLLPLMMLYVELGAAVISVHARRDHHISVARPARRAASGIGRPIPLKTAKAPVNASPAPVVSTTASLGNGVAGTWVAPSLLVQTMQPSAPSVTSTQRTPRSRSLWHDSAGGHEARSAKSKLS